MDLDKNQGIKHVKREDLGDFGADNIDGFMNYIAQQIGDDKESILPQVMQKNTESIALYNMSKAHRENLDTVTGAPTVLYEEAIKDDPLLWECLDVAVPDLDTSTIVVGVTTSDS